MSESANPNVPVQSEGTIVRGGSNPVFFEDMENIKPAKPEPKEREKAEPKAPPAKPSAPKKAEKKADVADDGDDEADKPRPDGKGKDKAEPKEKEAEGKEEKAKAKPKVHKARSGEAMLDIPGDAVFSIPVDGKNEEFTLDEMRAEISGKTDWSRKYSELGKEKQAHQASVKRMNDQLSGIIERAQKNHGEGLDFLAELVGQDPVDFKEKLIRAQIQELLPIAQMDDDEREVWLKDRVRDWRDSRYERRKADDEKTKAEAVAKTKVDQLRSAFGIDEDAYSKAEAAVKEHFKRLGSDETPTPEQVIQGERYLFAYDVVTETSPHVAERSDFGNIMEEVTNHLLRYPEITREQLTEILRETWPQEKDDKGLRNLGRKAKAADESGDAPRKPEPRSKAVFFEDL